jgi:hypothetical protein
LQFFKSKSPIHASHIRYITYCVHNPFALDGFLACSNPILMSTGFYSCPGANDMEQANDYTTTFILLVFSDATRWFFSPRNCRGIFGEQPRTDAARGVAGTPLGNCRGGTRAYPGPDGNDGRTIVRTIAGKIAPEVSGFGSRSQFADGVDPSLAGNVQTRFEGIIAIQRFGEPSFIAGDDFGRIARGIGE